MAVKAITLMLALIVSILSVSASFAPASLHFAADNEATIYLNGNRIASVHNWLYFATIKMALKPGDILAIIARDVGIKYGAIADLDLGKWGRCITKANAGPWRALNSAYNTDPNWKTSAATCNSWPFPSSSNVQTTPPGQDGSATYFPYGPTDYVWAKKAGENDMVHLCLVVPKLCLLGADPHISTGGEKEVSSL